MCNWPQIFLIMASKALAKACGDEMKMSIDESYDTFLKTKDEKLQQQLRSSMEGNIVLVLVF